MAFMASNQVISTLKQTRNVLNAVTLVSLQHALSDKASVKQFDPRTTCNQECLITTFQDVYFVSESFEEAKDKMR